LERKIKRHFTEKEAQMELNRRTAIDGKVAIVTGASSGIGESTARELARAGAITILAARREERLQRLEQEIRQMGGRALVVPTDLTNPEQITNLVQTTLTKFGRIDILANIAGWAVYDWFEELSPEEVRKPFEFNVIGMAELTRQVIPTMKAQRSGFILNMSSYVSRLAVPPMTVYASTKYAVEGLTDGLRRALLPWGITVIRIHPSSVTGTEFSQHTTRGGTVKYTPIPIGRISRERLARRIVSLIERPQRALFISRIYDIPVMVNRYFPGIVDRLSALWVRYRRRKEIPPVEQITPVEYQQTRNMAPLWLAAGSMATMAILFRLLTSKTFRRSPGKRAGR
jgi:NADP-dependent 3-hydroxy acid dehydrogenase YdfG